MKYFDISLPKPKKSEYISLFPICCAHIGHKNHDAEKFKMYLDYIEKTPDAYACSLGDDTEMALPGDEKHNAMTWDSNMMPDEQFEAVIEAYAPLVKKGKLLWTHDSNHWWRVEAKTGRSAAKELNTRLNSLLLEQPGRRSKKRPIEWGRWQSMCRLKVGKIVYLIHSWHGAGGGTTPEGALRKCRAKVAEHHADIYLVGHYHKKLIYEDLYTCWPKESDRPIERKRCYGVTGSFMKWDEGYGERFGLPQAMRGIIKVELSGTRWDAKVSL